MKRILNTEAHLNGDIIRQEDLTRGFTDDNTPVETVRKAGEPLNKLYNDDRPRQAYRLALIGCTNEQIAAVIGISISTFKSWCRLYPEFFEELERGRMHTDGLVAQSILKVCLGFEYIEEGIVTFKGQTRKVKIRKYQPPNGSVGLKWLAARRKDMGWGYSQQVDVTQRTVDLSDISTEELKMLERIGINNKNATIERN